MELTTLTDAKIDRYLATTKEALDKLEVVAPESSFARRIAENFLDMATRYHQDACHARSKGDFVNAFAQVNYAHGWLDAGARLGVFETHGDDRLFTLLD